MLTINLDDKLAHQVYTLHLTDAGNAEALAMIYGDQLRYVHGVGWHIWNGTYWKPDEAKETMMLVKDLSKHRQMAITRFEHDPKEKIDKLRTALKLEQAFGAKSCLDFAQSLPPFSCSTDALDRNPESLACSNGMLYPTLGFLCDSSQNEMLTKCVAVNYSEAAKAPRWLEFLNQVFTDQHGNPDSELILYIQTAIGYCLTGYTNERCLFVCYGQGANGKSTFINVVDYVLGNYAATIAFGNITDNSGERTGHDLAGLRGIRFLSAIETNQASYLDEAKIKRLTGGEEPITVRFLYGRYFRYVPTFKIWLACNHKPRIRGTDQAIWDRIRLVPFNSRFEKASPGTDKELFQKLKAEAEGIFAWMVEGCARWWHKGLPDCAAVRDSTRSYRTSEDYFQEFLDQNIQQSVGAFTPTEDVWLRHNTWAVRNGYLKLANTNRLGMAMSDKGYKSVQQSVQGKPKRGYLNIELT